MNYTIVLARLKNFDLAPLAFNLFDFHISLLNDLDGEFLFCDLVLCEFYLSERTLTDDFLDNSVEVKNIGVTHSNFQAFDPLLCNVFFVKVKNSMLVRR